MLRLIKNYVVGIFTLVAVAVASHQVSAAEPMTAVRAQDTVAIQQLVMKYAQSYDALDVEGYVGVFAEDAVFTFTNSKLSGRAEIRKFITDAKQRSASAPAKEPATKSYHSLSNTLIEFVSPTEARHRSYWQIVSGPAGGPFTVGNMGVYEDTIVKVNGVWLIQKRNIP